MEIGPNEPIDHLDERGSPDNRVELVEHQGFEGVKLVAHEPFGTCQPERTFSLMRTLLLRWRLVDEMLVVPRQHEHLARLVRHDGPEFHINGFGLGKRDDKVIEMRADGLEGSGHGGTVEICKHVEKQCQFRSDVLLEAQSAMRRAYLECFTQ